MHMHCATQLVLISSLLVTRSSGLTQTRACIALTSQTNVEVECSFNGKDSLVKNCTRPQPVGTIAKYKCKQFYIPFDDSSSEAQNQLRCDVSGNWNNLRKYESYRCKEACGIATGAYAEPLIINGVPTHRQFVPWHASLYIRVNASSWTYLCGGSLVRNQVVITAAHCLALDHIRVRDPETFRVVLGAVSSIYVENVAAIGAQIHSVQQFFVSQNYDPRKGYHADIAVIQLKEAIEFSDFVIPICLPNDYNADVNVIRTGVQGEIAGFGLTENGTIARTLRSVQLAVKSSSECFNSLHRVISESQFCAGGRRADDEFQTVCNGDSGGGLTFPSPVHKLRFIHGIVSSGDADTRKGLCQNYAVFTRIYPFIFWIRDVIEEISGEIARDLNQNVPYPYSFRGTEIQLAVFQALPREWENRVTTLEIEYASVNFGLVLASLEMAKALTSLRFTKIRLENPGTGYGIKGRVVLPLLSTFQLDILHDDFKVDGTGRTFPEPLSESYLKSLLFFDKDYDERDWSLSSILSLKTDVDLIVDIFKLIHINFKRGELALQQMPANIRILENHAKSSEFLLRNLALHRCSLNVEDIATATALVSLTLDRVVLQENAVKLTSILKSFGAMKFLALNPSLSDSRRKFELKIQDLPRQLLHLSVSETVSLSYEEEIQDYSSFRIFFPDSERISNSNPNPLFQDLKTFCCTFCDMNSYTLQNIPKLFPNLKSILIRSETETEITHLFDMPNLKSIYYENRAESVVKMYERKLGRWISSDVGSVRQNQAAYFCSGQQYFWTSEEDYRSLRRLKSFEKEALNSNAYKFTGSRSSQGLTVFPGIPVQIQARLKSITLTSVQVSPKSLFSSVADCYDLESVTLNDVSVIGSSKRYTFQAQSLEFRLETVKFVNFTLEYVYEFWNGELVAALVPFQHVGRFGMRNSSNTLHRLFTNINCLRLELTTATMYLFDTSMGELRANTAHIREMISSLDSSHPLSHMLINLKNIQKAYKDGILPPDWKLTGLHVIDPTLVTRFYGDRRAQILGELGVFRVLLQRYGKYLSLASLSLTALQSQNNTYPPVQAIALSLIKENVKIN